MIHHYHTYRLGILVIGLGRAGKIHAHNFPSVDAIVVATPTDYNKGIVVEAAASGKQVFCEKSMAMDVAECADMIAVCTWPGSRSR